MSEQQRPGQAPPHVFDLSTAPADQADTADGAIAQYVVHPALRGRLEAWLRAEGFETQRMPDSGVGDVATFVVVPGEDRARGMWGPPDHRTPPAGPDNTVHGPVWEPVRPPTGH